MEVSCYQMDLYCDLAGKEYSFDGIHKWNEFPHEYSSNTRQGCVKQARKNGWVFKRDGRVICPKCRNRKQINKE